MNPSPTEAPGSARRVRPAWRSLPPRAKAFRIAHVAWGIVAMGALAQIWTSAIVRRRKDRYIDRIEEEAAAASREAELTEQRLRARIAELEAGSPVDCTPVVAQTLDAERVAIRDFVEARRAA